MSLGMVAAFRHPTDVDPINIIVLLTVQAGAR